MPTVLVSELNTPFTWSGCWGAAAAAAAAAGFAYPYAGPGPRSTPGVQSSPRRPSVHRSSLFAADDACNGSKCKSCFAQTPHKTVSQGMMRYAVHTGHQQRPPVCLPPWACDCYQCPAVTDDDNYCTQADIESVASLCCRYGTHSHCSGLLTVTEPGTALPTVGQIAKLLGVVKELL